MENEKPIPANRSQLDLKQSVIENTRKPAISLIRQINSILDAVFYDTSALTNEEKQFVAGHTSAEGSILVVSPKSADRPLLKLTPWQFVEAQKNPEQKYVDTLAVAGVGSTAIGSAALARNIADYIQRPVAAIVSGYGLSDVISEALGGWFILGTNNAARQFTAHALKELEIKDHVRDPKTHSDMKIKFKEAAIDSRKFIYGSPDSAALLYILTKVPDTIKLIVGHSKGNLSIENALSGLLSSGKNRYTSKLNESLTVVTLSAVTYFPESIKNLSQFIGSIDLFGWINSRPHLTSTSIPGAWHTLNSGLIGHLSVRSALKLANIE